MNFNSKTLVAVFCALAVLTGGLGGAAAQTTDSIEAGSASDENISITVTDGTNEANGPYAIHLDVHNTLAAEDVVIEAIDYNGSNSDIATYTLSTAETVAGGSNVVLSTASDGTTADRYLGNPAVNDLTGDATVHYTVNGTAYSTTVAVDLDADGDQIPNSVDAYPTVAESISTHVVDTTNGAPATVDLTFANDTGTAEATIYDYNPDTATYNPVISESVDTANGAVTVSYDISDASDGSEYMVSAHGPATVDTKGITYADTSNDGTATDDSGTGTGPAPDISDRTIIGGLVVVIVVGGLFLYGRD